MFDPLGFVTKYALVLSLVGNGLLTVTVGIQTIKLANSRTETAKAVSQCDRDKADAVESALVDAKIEAGITAKRLSELKAKDDEAAQKLAKLEADKLIGDAAADRLRDRIKAYAAAARTAGSNPAPVASGAQAPSDPLGVLAELSDRLNAAAGIFAKHADEMTIRLERCNAQYDSLEVAE